MKNKKLSQYDQDTLALTCNKLGRDKALLWLAIRFNEDQTNIPEYLNEVLEENVNESIQRKRLEQEVEKQRIADERAAEERERLREEEEERLEEEREERLEAEREERARKKELAAYRRSFNGQLQKVLEEEGMIQAVLWYAKRRKKRPEDIEGNVFYFILHSENGINVKPLDYICPIHEGGAMYRECNNELAHAIQHLGLYTATLWYSEKYNQPVEKVRQYGNQIIRTHEIYSGEKLWYKSEEEEVEIGDKSPDISNVQEEKKIIEVSQEINICKTRRDLTIASMIICILAIIATYHAGVNYNANKNLFAMPVYLFGFFGILIGIISVVVGAPKKECEAPSYITTMESGIGCNLIATAAICMARSEDYYGFIAGVFLLPFLYLLAYAFAQLINKLRRCSLREELSYFTGWLSSIKSKIMK